MYCDYYDEIEENRLSQEYFENEMQNVKHRGFLKLGSIVSHLGFLNDIATTISNGYFEGNPSAEKIVQKLDLSKLELIAFQEDLEEFREMYMKNYNYYS